MLLQYKGYMLKTGQPPIHLIAGLRNITSLVSESNYKSIMKEIDKFN